MAYVKNNSFTSDTEENRCMRLILVQNNISTYATELGVGGQLLAWAEACYTKYSLCLTNAVNANGEKVEAKQEEENKLTIARNYYIKAKELLLATITEFQPDDLIVKAYGIDGPAPRKLMEFFTAVDVMHAEQLKLLGASDPRVLPQTVMDKLVALTNDIKPFVDNYSEKELISDLAFNAKHETFDIDSVKLRLLYTSAVIVWGDDSDKLKLFGFVPKSEIWTHDRLSVPQNFSYEASTFSLRWAKVEHATFYRIEHRLEGENSFSEVGVTDKNYFTLCKPFIGVNEFRVRAAVEDENGDATQALRIGIGVLGTIRNFRYDSTAESLKWDPVGGAICYLLLVNGEDLGELFYTTTVPFRPAHDERLFVQVWGTNGMASTELSDEIVIDPVPLGS